MTESAILEFEVKAVVFQENDTHRQKKLKKQ